MVVSIDSGWSYKWVLGVRNMGKYSAMMSKLKCKVGMKIVGTASILDIRHEGRLDISRKMSYQC